MRVFQSSRFMMLGLAAVCLILALGGIVQPDHAQNPTQAATEAPTQEAAGAPAMPPLPGDAIIGNLQAPRGVAFDANGNLIVAVAGSGGETKLTAPNPENPKEPAQISAGLSGMVLSIGKDGKATPLLQGLPSYMTSSGETLGIYRAVPNGNSLWLVYSDATSAGASWSDAVIELDAKTLTVKQVISMYPYEAAHNPDGKEINSNVSDIT